ncbi:uncharacterized protein PgNI_08544, partial [Pyricularia grisea]|uniref:Uncharacterized protein n=1 Tax=Pyricularia grisea TaxID=148305 RepID=A0A6P8AWB9_PYRGI
VPDRFQRLPRQSQFDIWPSWPNTVLWLHCSKASQTAIDKLDLLCIAASGWIGSGNQPMVLTSTRPK